ncbi:unnamed protein product [Pelagomonas calceolata]|uniref:Peptidase M3A/M3B catalytic domain-containing protein n=1 Tax=Pelagomonas calceolata TaxID=35677 RepID=A0A7S4EC02_9STRA|nr:unnamed protein product [Pelagomonas calceolata]
MMRRAVTRLARRNFGFAGTQIKTPSDWDAAATQAIATARTHADAINGKNRDPLLTLRRLDAVSVALCSVLDPAALCVAAHDCADWRAAASGAAARVEGVMEELNASAALALAAAACAAGNDLPPSARRLADAFHSEFSRDAGVAPARATERQAVQLLFATDFDESASWIRVPCVGAERVAAAVDAAAPGCASHNGDSVDLFSTCSAVSAFLTVSHDATARKIVFDHHEAALSFDALDVLASARRGVVTAHSALEGSLIGGVDAAKAFVYAALTTAKRRAAFEERRGAALLGLERLEPSDRLAAAHRLRERQPTDDGDVVTAICVAPPGFTVDEVPCGADEAWAPGVRKLVVAGRGTRATIYLDLEPRPGKPTGCAHYTVACACDVDGSGADAPAETWGLLTPSRLPAVGAIVSSSPDARALAHEWGHALHGAIHRSTSQHLAGTRGSTDAAELPATALEVLAPRRRRNTRGMEAVAALRGAVFDLALHGAYGCDVSTYAALAIADARAGAGRRADIIDWLPHVAEAPAALYAYPWGRARADGLWRRPDAESELLCVLEGDEARALDW